MLLKWLDAREATAAGIALADDFHLHSASNVPRARIKDGGQRPQEPELQKFLQRFLQRVDQAAQPLKLNVFKRAKLANSFKWRLLEKGVEHELVDELTQALVMRLTGAAVGSRAVESSASPRNAGDLLALHVAANGLLGKGAFVEARECYQQLVNLDPRDAVARNGLGAALAQLARYGEAESEFRRAIGIRPGYPEAHYNLAGVLQSIGRFNEAEMPLRRAVKLKPSYLDARISLGTTNILLGRLGDARKDFEKALRASPRSTRAMVGLGQVEALEGRFAEAEVAYRRALDADPGASHAWAALVWTRKMTAADASWVKRAEKFAESSLTPIDEATLRFAIGKYYDDVGDYSRAFHSYERANELHKLRLQPYDRKGHTRFVDDLIRTRTPDAITSASAAGSDSERPVFVVGMPRSGTSLVEQIIASHPAARGAGELNFWQVVARQHEENMRTGLLAETVRRKLGHDYLKVLAGHSADALRVVDKATVNADYLGIIHSVFPRARIVNLERDPIDTCLSCYFQQFPPSLNFTADLSDLAHYYREHHRLMAHWRRVLPSEAFLDVPYDELINEQEKWTRRILDFIGLPWDERCLKFYDTVRPVNTASVWQVRQKMYKTSVQRWRNYEKFIGPLRSLAELPR
jgi:tetratricopeptide (TPR) repeat protein